MRFLKITAPLAALVLLTGACGFLTPSAADDRPLPAVSPSGGATLKRVWKISSDTVNSVFGIVVGDTVIANAEYDKNQALFIDGRTGRIRGRATTGDLTTPFPNNPTAHPTSDEHGRPLVAIDQVDEQGAHESESVYDLAGHLVWKSHTAEASYAGGYVAEPKQEASGPRRLVIHTLAGRTVARLPLPFEKPSTLSFRLVRPGLLVAGGFGKGASRVALLDVSKPGRARVSLLRPPPLATPPAGNDGSTQVGVGSGGHLYVAWTMLAERVPIARYDVPGRRPVWHGFAPAGVSGYSPDTRLDVDPDANGGADAVAITALDRYWFLNPDSGVPTGPANGRAGRLKSVSGGRAYSLDLRSGPSSTNVVDLRTGTLRTVATNLTGATSSGLLIGASATGFAAYRLN